jgi:membrane protein DedA with SNARE-associated domain
MELLTEFLNNYGYWGFLAALIMIAIIPTPVPEDAITLGTGYLIANNQFELMPALPFLWLGVFIGDSYIYFLGYFFGSRVFSIKPLSYIYSDSRKQLVKEKLDRYGGGVVFLGRFVFGLRAQVYLNLGLLKFSPSRYAILNVCAILLHTSLMVCLGILFQSQISSLIDAISRAGAAVSQAVWALIGVSLLVFLFSQFKSRFQQRP